MMTPSQTSPSCIKEWEEFLNAFLDVRLVVALFSGLVYGHRWRRILQLHGYACRNSAKISCSLVIMNG